MRDIEDKFIKLLINNLPEDKLTELEILFEVGNNEKVQKFIGSMLPDIEKILSENLIEFNQFPVFADSPASAIMET